MKFIILLGLLLSSQLWARWSVVTYNIRNFDNDYQAGRTDLVELSHILKSYQSDVMAFEEVVNKQAFEHLVKTNLPGYNYVTSNCGGFGNQYLALAFNTRTFEYVHEVEDLSFSGSNDKCGSLRPLLLVTLREKATRKFYTFGVAHLKAGGNARAMNQRWSQYQRLSNVVKGYADQNLVLLGDFNTTGYNIRNEDYQKFEQLLAGSRLRSLSESLGCTSYWSGTLGGEEFESSILDHVILQDKNLNIVERVQVGTHCARNDCRPVTPQVLGRSFQSVSDHCPVQVVFR